MAELIRPGLGYRVKAAEPAKIEQAPGQPVRQLPPGTKIVDVFEEMNHSLLILDEPGPGKTTMLSDLRRMLSSGRRET